MCKIVCAAHIEIIQFSLHNESLNLVRCLGIIHFDTVLPVDTVSNKT